MASIDLVTIPARDIQYIIERLEKYEHMTHEDAANCVAELAHYYTALKHGKVGGPSATIDKAWHAHIHHVPYWSGHPSDGNEDDIYGYLVEQLGIDHINTIMWDRNDSVCINVDTESSARCQNKCKACNSCNSIG